MAKYAGSLDWNVDESLPFQEQIEAESQMLEELRTRSDALDPDQSVVGAVLNFPVADGYAWYLVTDENPLTIAHIPFLDAYRVHDAMVKGLDRDDVREHLYQRKKLLELFSPNQS